MSTTEVVKDFKTGLSLDQALSLIPAQLSSLEYRWRADYELDELPEDEPWPPEFQKEFDACAFLERVADSRFVQSVLTVEDSKRIEATVKQVPFFLARDWAADRMFFQTAGFQDELWRQVEEELRSTSEEAREDWDVEESWVYSFDRVVDEAVLYHLLNPEPEIRRCAMCGTWFQALYRGRARFCGVGGGDCRKKFAALSRASDTETFPCTLGEHDAPLSVFSGLALRDGTGSERPTLKMSGLLTGKGALTCAPCVHQNLPQWQNYIVPVMATIGKTVVQ